VLSVPSSVTAGDTVTFTRCRQCHGCFVIDYQAPTYEATSVSDASLRFYVEQGAGFDTLARTVFLAAQKPVRNYLDVGCGFGFGVDMASHICGWNAVGLDPGPLAAAGREMLGIRLEGGPLSTQRHRARAPYDAIAAIEVLEHIADPHAFLKELRLALSDTGTLILSTPNARYLETHPDGEMLLPLLSAGYHAILYTAQGLTGILRKAGFRNVGVAETPANLLVTASPSGWLPRLECDVDRGAYVRYLRSRYGEVERGSALHIGFGQRLLRCLTEDHAYKEALAVFDDLRDTILTTHRVDIHRPLDIAGHIAEMQVTFAEVPERLPFCLPGVLASRGSIAADFDGRPEQAVCYYVAGSFTARMLLRALEGDGMSDGELAAVAERAAMAVAGLLRKQTEHGFSAAAASGGMTARSRKRAGGLLYA
jgi:SAM-dependent methyltransferase